MVTIVDPHVKRDHAYYVYKEAHEKKYFVRKSDGGEFDGWCWPGEASDRCPVLMMLLMMMMVMVMMSLRRLHLLLPGI